MFRRGSSRSRRLVLAICVSVLAACGGSSGGPDIATVVDGVVQPTSRFVAGATASGSEELGIDASGADIVWRVSGSPTVLADRITSTASPDERTESASGDVFLLYPAGTLWLTKLVEPNVAVLLYRDNDRARTRHRTLVGYGRWGSRLGSYRSSRISGSNGGTFRGGGSGSGK